MKSISRYWLVFVLVTIAVSATIWLRSRSVPDPVYNGRKLSAWIQDLPGSESMSRGIVFAPLNLQVGESEFSNDPKSVKAEEAVRHIGTNGLPLLMAELHAPNRSRERLAEAWMRIEYAWNSIISRGQRPKMPRMQDTKQSGERRRWYAALALHVLGPAATPVIPQLVPMLNQSGGGDGCPNAAYALSGMGPAGVAPLIPLLTNASRGMGRDWNKSCAIWAFGQSPEAGRMVVPQLLVVLQDKKNPFLASDVIWTLGQLHTNDELIAPAVATQVANKTFNIDAMAKHLLEQYGMYDFTRQRLKEDMFDRERYIRMAATNAYLALYPDEAAQLGIK